MRRFQPLVLWIALLSASEAWAGGPREPQHATSRPAPSASRSAPKNPPRAGPRATPSSAPRATPAARPTPTERSARPPRVNRPPNRTAGQAPPHGSSKETGVRPSAERRPNTEASRQRQEFRRNGPARLSTPGTRPAPPLAPRVDGRVPANRSVRRDFTPLQRNPSDHRYARPSSRAVHERHIVHPRARHAPPRHYTYVPYYTRWWVHPYWRYQYATTSMVAFDFSCDPWSTSWAPPSRSGWSWQPGYWAWGQWHPGYWAPLGPDPYPGYNYVPGFWSNTVYVEGYYRPAERPAAADDGWEWVDGYYTEDDSYVWGYWMPTSDRPEGYGWEPGFYDGEDYIDGFWRPDFRSGYTWVSAFYDDDGVYHAGYWAPTVDEPGKVWIPGWFDGNAWQDGYWVDEADYDRADPETYQPEDGWDAGWNVGSGWGAGAVIENQSRDDFGSPDWASDDAPIAPTNATEAIPLAIPVEK